MPQVAAISQQIWDMKYRLKGPDGQAVDKNIEESWRRVANALAQPEESFLQIADCMRLILLSTARQQDGDILMQQFVGAVSKQQFRCRIQAFNTAAFIDRNNRIDRAAPIPEVHLSGEGGERRR